MSVSKVQQIVSKCFADFIKLWLKKKKSENVSILLLIKLYHMYLYYIFIPKGGLMKISKNKRAVEKTNMEKRLISGPAHFSHRQTTFTAEDSAAGQGWSWNPQLHLRRQQKRRQEAAPDGTCDAGGAMEDGNTIGTRIAFLVRIPLLVSIRL